MESLKILRDYLTVRVIALRFFRKRIWKLKPQMNQS